jgi:hypothetical protein
MDNPLKFEPPVDQILKGVDHAADMKDELGLFCSPAAYRVSAPIDSLSL